MMNRGERMAEKKKKDVEEETVDETLEETAETDKKDESVDSQLAKLEEEVNTWKTDYYKVFADMENLKRRLEKEHQNSLKFMMQSFIEELLPVVDNFERSLNVENPSEEIQTFLKGYQMIFDQLMAILEKNGVEVIEAQGQEFDPNFHQAVMTANDENYGHNIVVEELQKGYKLKDRVIRASLVKVNE
jgi:molecular chaperone GrpE